jgi:hypothetical protein
MTLLWWPLSCAMQDAQHPPFVLSVKDLIDCNVWGWGKSDLPRAMHTTRSSEMREGFQSVNALHDGLRHASCGLWAALGCYYSAN